MGPGNTFLMWFRDRGLSLRSPHFQNLIGNTSKKWVDDGSSAGTIRHGEKVNGVLMKVLQTAIPVPAILE